jgi:hypothetical protein
MKTKEKAKRSRKKPAFPDTGNYVEDRKAWYKKITLEQIFKDYEKTGDAAVLADLERIRKRKRKAS